MNRIAVFCGSNSGSNGIFMEQARLLGETLAIRKIELIYGGAKVGLMGAVADGVLSKGGKVTGIIPGFLKTKEVAHEGLNQLITVDTMHERKAIAYEMSDGAIVLPGGYGTLDEAFEMITWGQLGLHPKPVALLNVNGYYDPLLAMADKMLNEGFINLNNRNMLIHEREIEPLLRRMLKYVPPVVPKWILDKNQI